MRPIPPLAIVLTMALLVCSSVQALEALKSYETFSATPLNPDLWADAERTRIIQSGVLNLVQRNWPATTSNSGSAKFYWDESMSDPQSITAIKAKVKVNSVEVSTCAANPAISQSRARIVGAFFNIGSPVPGSQVGDVIAQVRLMRASNSVDPAGVLQVTGSVVACTNADCSSSTALGNPVNLGTVTIGTATTVQMQWDQPGKRFKFSRDSAAFSGNVAYTQADASPPSVAFKQLSTLMDVPNCLAGPRVNGLVDATFDQISVNSSAAP